MTKFILGTRWLEHIEGIRRPENKIAASATQMIEIRIDSATPKQDASASLRRVCFGGREVKTTSSSLRSRSLETKVGTLSCRTNYEVRVYNNS